MPTATHAHLDHLKSLAKQHLESLHIPTQKDEDWLYTPPEPFLDVLDYKVYDQEEPSYLETKQQEADAIHLTINNGKLINKQDESVEPFFSYKTSQGDCLFLPQLSRYQYFETALLAQSKELILLDVKQTATKPIHIRVSSKQVASNQVQIRIAAGQHATFYVQFDCEETLLMNWMLHCEVGASCEIVKVAAKQNTAAVCFSIRTALEDEAKFYSHCMVLEQDNFRLDARVNSIGKNTQTELNGVALLQDKQRVSFNTEVYLQDVISQSHQEYRTVLKGASQADYNGLVYVEPEAQQINSDQMNRNMILESGPRAYSRPQLQIFADDVRCTHGSTTGQLDPGELLYIQSRGIDEKEARKLLLIAYVYVVLDIIQDVSLKEKLSNIVEPLILRFLSS